MGNTSHTCVADKSLTLHGELLGIVTQEHTHLLTGAHDARETECACFCRGPMAWNGVRHHHMDALQLSDGSWLAVMDGDSVISGHISRGVLSKLGLAATVLACGLCLWCSHERCLACARSRVGRVLCLPLFARPMHWSKLRAKSSAEAPIDLSEPPIPIYYMSCLCLCMAHARIPMRAQADPSSACN